MVEVLGTLAPGGYNLREGGGSTGKHSEESIRKMSEALRGEKHPMWGEHHSEETKQKQRTSQLGKTRTKETRQKQSEAHSGEKNHMWGKTHNEETRRKQSEAKLGIPKSEETKQKHSESKKGEKNYKSKRVYQYDLNGTLINSFASCGEAARHLHKNDGSSICACARGDVKTMYKFKWSYININ